MRVCHVVRQYAPGIGGLERFVATLAYELQRLGCDNDILTLDRLFHDRQTKLPAEEFVAGIRVRRVPMIGHPRFFLPIISRDLLADYDVIHVHGIDGMFDRIARQPRGRRQAFIATSHGLFFHTPWMSQLKRLYLLTATRLAATRYDLLIANSMSDKARLSSIASTVLHLPNGVAPLGPFTASGNDLLCLGRLAEHKHVDRIIAALAEPNLNDVRLHVVGPDWNVSALRLARVAESHGVSQRVLLHGSVSHEKLAEIAKECALYVSASTYEGFGMSLIEAMSVGLVPVVHPNPAFVELVDAAGIGVLADFSRPAFAAKAIRHQIDQLNPEARQRAVDFSRIFAWSGHAERTLRLYRAGVRVAQRA